MVLRNHDAIYVYYSLFFTSLFSQLSLVELALTWLTNQIFVLQCYDTVGWVN